MTVVNLFNILNKGWFITIFNVGVDYEIPN